MIKLYQFPPIWNVPNPSPFCLKVETYLRITNIPFEIHIKRRPASAPKGKLPFIKDGEKIIADSSLILPYLVEKFGDRLDNHLSNEQQAMVLCIQRLVEEHLYWVCVYSRQIDEKGWPVLKSAFFGKLKGISKLIIPYLLQKKILKTLYGQGIGRHTKDEIYQFGISDIKALSELLGNHDYFFNEKISTIDIISYAFVTNIINVPVEVPLKNFTNQCDNLINHTNRIHELAFG